MIKTLLLIASLSFTLNADSVDEKMMKEGQAIYEQTCISCHGEDGATNAAMMLVIKPRKLDSTILTKEQSFKIIKEGAHHWGAHSDLMPAFKYVYDDSQLHSVAYFISKKFNANRDEKVKKLLAESSELTYSEEKTMKTGAKIFKRNCSLCHGITGNGQSVYVEQSKANNMLIYPYDLTKTLLEEDQIFLYAKHGGHYWGADKTDMPSWKKKYDDEKLKSVARYIELKIKTVKE